MLGYLRAISQAKKLVDQRLKSERNVVRKEFILEEAAAQMQEAVTNTSAGLALVYPNSK
jgi:hypothetical protein